MVNTKISDSFETLGGAASSAGNQVKQIIKQIGTDAAESVGLKPVEPAGTAESGGQQAGQNPQDDQAKKTEAKNLSLARKRYREIQQEIKQFSEKRRQEMTKYNQPGFTDEEKQEKQIKQLEEKKEDKLPPLVAQRAQRKTERQKGVSG